MTHLDYPVDFSGHKTEAHSAVYPPNVLDSHSNGKNKSTAELTASSRSYKSHEVSQTEGEATDAATFFDAENNSTLNSFLLGSSTCDS